MQEINKGNVLFLCEYQSLYSGNFIPSLMALEEGLKEKNIACVYAFPKQAKARDWVRVMEAKGKKIIFFDFHVSRWRFIKQLDKVVKQNNIYLIHSHFAHILKVECYALLHRHVRVFIHMHSDLSAGKSSLKLKIKSYILYHACSGGVNFFSVSQDLARVNPNKIQYVPNALADKRLSDFPIDGDKVRRENNIDKDSIFCELFGWSPLIKGVDIAVNAISRLNDSLEKPIILGIVCGREMTPDKMQQWIQLHTHCSGKESFIRYLQPREDVFSYHAAADFLLLASRSEGFPYSVLEMLSLGKNCVVSDIPSVAWAKKYDLVHFFTTADSDSCMQTIKSVIKCPKMQNNDLAKRIKKDYSIDQWVKTIIQSDVLCN